MSNQNGPPASIQGPWRVRLVWDENKQVERMWIKLYPILPDSFSDQLFDYFKSVLEPSNVQYHKFPHGSGDKEYIAIVGKALLCLYFISTHIDMIEFDKSDYLKLRERFLRDLNKFYMQVFDKFYDKIMMSKDSCRTSSTDKISASFLLKNFQLDLIREGVHKKGRFILNEKKIVGKRVIAYQIMRFFLDKSKKIIIIAAKKNTHHWRELICQWDDSIGKKNIILYKKEHKLSSLMKKTVVIINDNLVKECLKDSPQLFNKNSNLIIDKEVQFLDEIAEKIKDQIVRVGYICQNFAKLKIVEKLALNTLFDCVKNEFYELFEKSQTEPQTLDEDSLTKSDKKLENLLVSNNNIQKYFISLDEKIRYPEFEFKVFEQAFIINYDDEEIEKIKSLKNMVTNGNSIDIINTYKDKFEKNDEDIRNMSKNLKGTFKDPEKYFYNHSLESMKRAIDFYCTKLFAETKIHHTKTIIEKLILSGKKKIVVWAFHCNILQKIANFIKDLKGSKGYKVLEVASNMPDDKRNEIIMEYNKLEVGFLIIPFSVKKERFKNLDFDVFLFVELTYNLEYYLTARKILYSPYLTKNKHLYIILSPPADSYIWIKFETIYKRPEWEKCIKELKENNLSFVVHDLEVKDDKNKTMSSDLEQIKIQLEIHNQKLKLENKRKSDKVKELRDKKKTNKKTNHHEIEPYINALSETNILTKDETDKFMAFLENDPIRINNKLYVTSFNSRRDGGLRQVLLEGDVLDIDTLGMPEPNAKTLRNLKASDKQAFKTLFCDRLEAIADPDPKIYRVEQEFDVNKMQQMYFEMIDTLGENKFTNLSTDVYSKTIEDLGFDVELKDPTQSSKVFQGPGALPANRDCSQDEDDAQFYDEFMSMLIGAYITVQRSGKNLSYYFQPSSSSSGDKREVQKSRESSFERNLLEGMLEFKENGNPQQLHAVIDRSCPNLKIRDLIKENFQAAVRQPGDSVKSRYSKVDYNERILNSQKRDKILLEEPLHLERLNTDHPPLFDLSLKIEPPQIDDMLFTIKQEHPLEDHDFDFFSAMDLGHHDRDHSDDLNTSAFLLGKRKPSVDSFEEDHNRPYIASNDFLDFDSYL